MIDLHKEKGEAYKYSDPLCIALQILNHLQDCKEDYEKFISLYQERQGSINEFLELARGY